MCCIAHNSGRIHVYNFLFMSIVEQIEINM